MLPEFELWLPRTLPDALQQLAAAAPEGAPLAGGTNVVPDLRSGRHCPKVLVDVSKLEELRGIRREDGHITAGGGATLTDLLASPLVAETASPLRQAAALFANPLIRNRATLAGNLADASPAADTVPPLMVLDAEVDLISQSGCRTVPLDGFFTGVRKTVRRPDELIQSVRWPASRTRHILRVLQARAAQGRCHLRGERGDPGRPGSGRPLPGAHRARLRRSLPGARPRRRSAAVRPAAHP